MKSSAVSEKTILAALLFTSTGTSTRFEREVSVGTRELGSGISLLCALIVLTAKESVSATIKASFKRFVPEIFPTSLGTLPDQEIANNDQEKAFHPLLVLIDASEPAGLEPLGS